MAYLIDTDWTIDHLGDVEEATQLLTILSRNGIAISIITYMEVYQGLIRSPNRVDALTQFDIFLTGVPIIPFSMAIARQCAGLRENLKRQGKRVNPRSLDLIIAATAIEHDLFLVTRNVRDYGDIPNLKLYKIE